MHHGDVEVRQRHLRIDRTDALVVPLGDLLEIDVGENIGGDPDGTPRNARQIVNDRFGPDRHWNVQHRAAGRLLQLLFGHDAVAGAEIHRHLLELADAATGADGLIVHLHAAQLVVGIEHFGEQREVEGRAGAGQFLHALGRAIFRRGLRGPTAHEHRRGERDPHIFQTDFHRPTPFPKVRTSRTAVHTTGSGYVET